MRLADAYDELDRLEAQALRLWPNDAYLQQEWLHAVYVVRSTRIGWLLDLIPQPVPENVVLLKEHKA